MFLSPGHISSKSRPSTAATLACFNSLMSVLRYLVITMIAVLIVSTAATANVARRTKKPLTCVSRHSRLIVADTQAEIFEAEEPRGGSGALGVWGCVYGRRAYFLGPLPSGSSFIPDAPEHLTLAGSMAAYEESVFEGRERAEGRAQWRIVVRDLRNGHVVHRVPTGTPAQPEAGLVGVGNVLALIVRSDGSAAWIAEDNGRTKGVGTLLEKRYFDVEDVDKSGAHLLASGTDVDPSSLALSVVGANVLGELVPRPGDKLYWRQNGQSFSVILR